MNDDEDKQNTQDEPSDELNQSVLNAAPRVIAPPTDGQGVNAPREIVKPGENQETLADLSGYQDPLEYNPAVAARLKGEAGPTDNSSESTSPNAE
jgi:hypothetical protein